jgi:hypothetical protein
MNKSLLAVAGRRGKNGGQTELKLLHSPKSIIDMGSGELAHILFSLEMSRETALADEFHFMPVFKIDMTAPRPCVGVWIFLHYADEGLIAMRILDSISLPVLRAGFHSTTVLIVGSHSKRIIRIARYSRLTRDRNLVHV